MSATPVRAAGFDGSEEGDFPGPEDRRQIEAIAGDMIGVFPDFCVAPDGKHVYYSLLEVSVSQIRMMEGGF